MADYALQDERMDGQNIAQYRIVEKLGAGGMGQIYRAHDSRLNRSVAIKVLPQASSNDPERRKRFLIEAQAASALNHPNIITIHDVLSNGDTECMVMELVEGKTLNEIVPRGGLRVPRALNYMLQMADALAAAHSAGIVHRDLKPANIMVTNSGLVKILDFGLAKLLEQGPALQFDQSAETSDSGRATMGLTMEGSILGTLNYMSPEQAEGKKVDTRSDIFSFGAVLYEMLTGVPPFQGDSGLSTLSAILREPVKPLVHVAPDVPAVLDGLVRKCLEKNPDDRWQSMTELRAALLSLKRESDSGTLYGVRLSTDSTASGVIPPKTVPALSQNRVKLAAVAIAGMVVIGAGIWFFLRPTGSEEVSVPAQQEVAENGTPATANPETAAQEILNDDGVIKLLEGKVPLDLILSHIQSAPTTAFNLTTEELIRLSKAGASSALIDQMRDPKKPVAPAARAVAANVSDKPTPAAATEDVELVDGTPLKITLTAAVPADASLGMPLRFNLAEDLKVQGNVVLAKGAQVAGEITQIPKKGFLGIGNEKMSFSLSMVQGPGGTTVKLRVVPARKGDDIPQRAVQVSGKTKSKDVAADQGTEYLAYIDGAQKVPVRKK